MAAQLSTWTKSLAKRREEKKRKNKLKRDYMAHWVSYNQVQLALALGENRINQIPDVELRILFWIGCISDIPYIGIYIDLYYTSEESADTFTSKNLHTNNISRFKISGKTNITKKKTFKLPANKHFTRSVLCLMYRLLLHPPFPAVIEI